MTETQIEYCVAGSARSGWKVFRQNSPLARRRDMFDAVALATQIAEREARISRKAVKVTFGSHEIR